MSSRRGYSRRNNGQDRRGGGGHRRGGNGDACFNCGKRGHFAHSCPRNRRQGGGGAQQRAAPQQQQQPSRDRERRFFDKLSRDTQSQTSIRGETEATRFLGAAIKFGEVEGAAALLYRLAEPQMLRATEGALQKSLEYATDREVFVDGFLPLVERLGQPELHKPVYEGPMKALLSYLYSLPFLVPCILQHVKDGHVARNEERTSLIWLFTKIAREPENSTAREDADIRAIADLLSAHAGSERLRTVLGWSSVTASEVSLEAVRLSQSAVPGGRNDNDKQDFRSNSIVPTVDEFMCDAEPFLPRALDMENADAARLLDRHFRLLREDIIGPSKELQDDPRKQQRDVFYGARVSHVETGAAVHRKQAGKMIKMMGASEPCIVLKFQIPKWSRVHRLNSLREKEEYWDKNRRALPRDGLVCLQRKDQAGRWLPIRFGVIVRREAKELAVDPPLIGISFLKDEDTRDMLKELSDQSVPPTRLFVVSGDLFAYQPILRALQSMDSIPFPEELVEGKQVAVASNDSVEIANVPSNLKGRIDQLDQKQRDAFEKTLQNRVALIQGPPGTGKTFIGVLLAQILLGATNETILLVTFTNHALDDFLQSLLDAGITDIVRLGGRSKNERLAEFNLREKARSGKAPFSREQTRRFAQLKEMIEEAEKDVERLKHDLGKEIGKGWWKRMKPFLEDHHPECWNQLHLSLSDFEDSQGFSVQGISGEDHLWKSWLKSKKPPTFLLDKVGGPLWDMSKEERNQMKLAWQHEMYEDQRHEMATALKTIQTAKAELKQLQEVTDASILSQARVIGCTTTKAAMCKSLLDGISAGIVLVEEAAEVMEAHILTSLSPGSKRLIMIGDHKQLRPKCQHYPLTVESGRGLNLNQSLFERLAASLPISTLGVQHRMHPDISAIPKLVTYSDLQDAPKVLAHPSPKGLQSRVIFVHHEHLEDHDSGPSDGIESVSRTNQHEVSMVLATVRYLLQQGYKSG